MSESLSVYFHPAGKASAEYFGAMVTVQGTTVVFSSFERVTVPAVFASGLYGPGFTPLSPVEIESLPFGGVRSALLVDSVGMTPSDALVV